MMTLSWLQLNIYKVCVYQTFVTTRNLSRRIENTIQKYKDFNTNNHPFESVQKWIQIKSGNGIAMFLIT